MIRPIAAAILLLASALPAAAQDSEEAQCIAAIAATRDMAEAMPVGDPSRRYAENALDTARLEMASGEVDECPELIERARHIIETRPYILRPGEALGVTAR